MNISDIKMVVQNNANQYVQKYDGKREYAVSIGTKIAEVKVNFVEEIKNPNLRRVSKRRTLLYTLEMKLDKIIEDSYFIKIREVSGRNSYYEKNTDLIVDRRELNFLAAELIKYWLSYGKIKNAQAIYFGLSTYQKDIMEEYKEMFSSQGIDDLNYFNEVIESGFPILSGKVEPGRMTAISNAISIQSQINRAMSKHPTFIVEDIEGNELTKNYLYKFNNLGFYFEGVRFGILFDGTNIQVSGEKIGTQNFLVEENIIEDGILKYIHSIARLQNLINPPIKFFKEFITSVYSVRVSDSKYEDLIQNIEEKIGAGQVEVESKEAASYVKKYRDYSYSKRVHDKEARARFKQIDNDAYVVCRVKTEKFHWFVLVNKNNYDFIVVPSLELSMPQEITDGIGEIIKRLMLEDV